MASIEKTPKAKPTPVALPKKVCDMLTKAVLSRKVSVQELEEISSYIGKLKSILQ